MRKMGIRTVMITGDNLLTASAIAAEAGVDDYIAQDIQWKAVDKAWKETAQPTVDLGKDALGFGRIVKWIIIPALGLLAYLRWN